MIGCEFGQRFGESSEKIVALIFADNYISAVSIAEKVNLSSRAVEKQIAKLRSLGIIQRIGAAKGGHWKILVGIENS